MKPEQFVFWLRGFAELHGEWVAPSELQWQIIKDHIGEVFHKVTPNRNLGYYLQDNGPKPSGVIPAAILRGPFYDGPLHPLGLQEGSC